MPVGAITQEIYARGLPNGTKLLLTNVSWKTPGSGWGISFSGMKISMSEYQSEETRKSQLPIEVTKDVQEGKIGTITIKPDVSNTGTGPEIYLDFKLEGGVKEDEHKDEIDLGNVTGRLTVSTTDWGWIERPDYVNVAYQIQNSNIQSIAIEVQSGQSPKDVSLAFAIDGEKIGLAASIDPNLTKDLINIALLGISWAHEKALSWAWGAI